MSLVIQQIPLKLQPRKKNGSLIQHRIRRNLGYKIKLPLILLSMRKWDSFLAVQVVAWILLATLFFLERVTWYRDIGTVFVSIFNTLLTFVLVIYGYIYLVYRVLFRKIPLPAFVLIVIVFLGAAAAIHLLIQASIVYPSSGFSEIARPNIAYTVISVFLAFIIGMLLQTVINNLQVRRTAIESKEKQTEAEMKWLKAQVQPHFFFNALNNIYYEASERTTRTAELIEKLAAIMRYLLEQTATEKVSLDDEITFINNYIEFENLRLYNKVNISFYNRVMPGTQIPPLLLMPLIENLFKHGINKKQTNNKATVTLQTQDNYLAFSMSNECIQSNATAIGGFGLKNLRERLQLLYGNNFILNTRYADNEFIAELKIPLS
jgi:sensor histidine kinase YesM